MSPFQHYLKFFIYQVLCFQLISKKIPSAVNRAIELPNSVRELIPIKRIGNTDLQPQLSSSTNIERNRIDTTSRYRYDINDATIKTTNNFVDNTNTRLPYPNNIFMNTNDMELQFQSDQLSRSYTIGKNKLTTYPTVKTTKLTANTGTAAITTSISTNPQNDFKMDQSKYQVVEKTLPIFFLQHELKLREDVLVNIIVNHAWILYLKVETNLRPTIDVFKSYGFNQKEIRSVIERIPSILGINAEYTLHEKLLALRQMFNVNRQNLIKLVVEQPLLLSSSIARNTKISLFLSNTMELEYDEIRLLIGKQSTIAMTSIEVLLEAWSVLTGYYKIPSAEAKALCLKYPILLAKRFLDNHKNNFALLTQISSSSNVNNKISASMRTRSRNRIQKTIRRFPPILCFDRDYFLITNLNILQHFFNYSTAELFDIVVLLPNILLFNPNHLALICGKLLYFLTGTTVSQSSVNKEAVFVEALEYARLITSATASADGNSNNGYDDCYGDSGRLRGALSSRTGLGGINDVVDLSAADDEKDSSLEMWDLISDNDTFSSTRTSNTSNNLRYYDILQIPLRDFDRKFYGRNLFDYGELEWNPGPSTNANNRATNSVKVGRNFENVEFHLFLERERAVKIINSLPSILSRRLDLHLVKFWLLTASLGVNVVEINRIVEIYPRILAMSITKLSEVLVRLTGHVVTFFEFFIAFSEYYHAYSTGMNNSSSSKSSGVMTATKSSSASTTTTKDTAVPTPTRCIRSHVIRQILYEIVMKYPLILGSSLDRIETRLQALLLVYDVDNLEWIVQKSLESRLFHNLVLCVEETVVAATCTATATATAATSSITCATSQLTSTNADTYTTTTSYANSTTNNSDTGINTETDYTSFLNNNALLIETLAKELVNAVRRPTHTHDNWVRKRTRPPSSCISAVSTHSCTNTDADVLVEDRD